MGLSFQVNLLFLGFLLGLFVFVFGFFRLLGGVAYGFKLLIFGVFGRVGWLFCFFFFFLTF